MARTPLFDLVRSSLTRARLELRSEAPADEVAERLPLPEVKRRAIDEVGYGTNAKAMIGYCDRVWRRVHRRNGSVVTEQPFQLAWETSRKQPGSAGILTNFTGGRHGVATGTGTPEAWADRVTREVEVVSPGIAATREGMKEARFHWLRTPGRWGATRRTGRASGAASAGPRGWSWAGSTSRGSTPPSSSRASWREGANRASSSPARSWRRWGSGGARRRPAGSGPAVSRRALLGL